MHRLAAATLAANNTVELPVSGSMLLGEFVGLFIIAMVYTIVKASAKNHGSPVRLGLVMGFATGALAVVLTIILGNALQ